jgi:hypothetical protein
VNASCTLGSRRTGRPAAAADDVLAEAGGGRLERELTLQQVETERYRRMTDLWAHGA